jgi:hypothetical protein
VPIDYNKIIGEAKSGGKAQKAEVELLQVTMGPVNGYAQNMINNGIPLDDILKVFLGAYSTAMAHHVMGYLQIGGRFSEKTWKEECEKAKNILESKFNHVLEYAPLYRGK